MEKAVILSENDQLTEKDFGINQIFKFRFTKTESLDLSENEKQLILKAIEKSNGNFTIAAKELGVSRKTLYNKIKKYGLE